MFSKKKGNTNVFSFPKGYNWRHWNNSNRVDYVLSIVSLGQLVLAMAQQLLIFNGIPSEITSTFRIISSALTIFLALPFILKRNLVGFILTYIIALIIYIICTTLFPYTEEPWIKEGFRFLLPICIPTCFCVALVRKKAIFYIAFKHVSYLLTLMGFLLGLRIFSGAYVVESYNMSLGYLLLIPIIVMFYIRKPLSLAIGLILVAILFAYGSRGPLVALAAFLTYLVISRGSIKMAFLIALIFSLGYSAMSTYMKDNDIKSRTFLLMESGEFISYDAGRDDIQETVIKAIWEKPLTGWGIYGDRYASNTVYSHNIILEVFCDFGIITGTFLLAFFFYYLIKTFIKSNMMNRDVLFILFCASFIPLLVSSSFLNNTDFALFLGFIVLLNKKKNRKNKKVRTIIVTAK